MEYNKVHSTKNKRTTLFVADEYDLQTIVDLFNIAKADFEALEMKNVEVFVSVENLFHNYHGAHFTGISFDSFESIPDDYFDMDTIVKVG